MQVGDPVFVDVSSPNGPPTVVIGGKYVGRFMGVEDSVSNREVLLIELDEPLRPVDGHGSVEIIASAPQWVFPKPI
jgi:hypothetical protein